jgi:hypothetical protein
MLDNVVLDFLLIFLDKYQLAIADLNKYISK